MGTRGAQQAEGYPGPQVPHLGGGGLRTPRLLRSAPPPQRLRRPLLLARHWPQRSPIQPPGRRGAWPRVPGPRRRCRRCALRCGRAGGGTMNPGAWRGECGRGPAGAPGRPPWGRGAGSRGCGARAADLPWSLPAAGGAASSLRILHPDRSRPACGLACSGVLLAACTEAPAAPGLVRGAASLTAHPSPALALVLPSKGRFLPLVWPLCSGEQSS